jgi:hypothetical protein
LRRTRSRPSGCGESVYDRLPALAADLVRLTVPATLLGGVAAVAHAWLPGLASVDWP